MEQRRLCAVVRAGRCHARWRCRRGSGAGVPSRWCAAERYTRARHHRLSPHRGAPLSVSCPTLGTGPVPAPGEAPPLADRAPRAENPGAPASLRGRDKAPGININVNCNANPVADKEYDVTLTLSAKASYDKEVLFNVELVYGGVFRVDGFPQEHMLPILFIECPRLLFPFACQIIAEATRNGGFPPLLIDPIDFASMFQQRMAEEQGKSAIKV